jgi:predicted RecA/RadA family phage recombinase
MAVLNERQCAEYADYVTRAHTTAVTVGTPVAIPGIGAGVPQTTASSGVVTTFKIKGIFLATIATAVTVVQGDKLYYNSATTTVQKTIPAAGFFLGTANENGTATAGYVEVSLNECGANDEGVRQTSAAALVDTAPTLTAAQILGGHIVGIPTAGRTYTLPATSVILAARPYLRVGDTVRFTILNNSAGNFTITLAVDSGATITNTGLAGHLTVGQNARGSYELRITSTTAGAETADLIPA